MPLKSGSSKNIIAENIKTLRKKENKPKNQAIAIVYSMAGKSKKKKKGY